MSTPTRLKSTSQPLAAEIVTAKSRSIGSSTWKVRTARRLVLRSIGRITKGELRLVEALDNNSKSDPAVWLFGQPSEDALHAEITVLDPRFWACMVTG